MSGRRLTPNPAQVQPVSEFVEPSLAQPVTPMGVMPSQNPGTGPNVGVPAMVSPQLMRAQQEAEEAAKNIAAFQPASEPFAKFHGDNEGPPGFEPKQGEKPEESEEEEEEKVTELTPAERGLFSSLLTLGRMTDIVDVFGHPVEIESLSVGDDQRIGLYCKDYQNAPPADSRSYQIAVCAAGIRKMAGLTIYQPISDEESAQSIFLNRATQIEKLYPAVITEIYRAIMNLDVKFAELLDKLGKQKG